MGLVRQDWGEWGQATRGAHTLPGETRRNPLVLLLLLLVMMARVGAAGGAGGHGPQAQGCYQNPQEGFLLVLSTPVISFIF